VNGFFYSLVVVKLEKENISSTMAKLFWVEDDNLSAGPHVLCKNVLE